MDARKPAIFFDFDNTITPFDILDDMLLRFSSSDKWRTLEERWQKGEIGSAECLKGQLAGIRITREALDKYLSGIKIDPSFAKLTRLFGSAGIRMTVLSDNFSYIINNILRNNGISGLDVYSNTLDIAKDMLAPRFPLSDKSCGDCGHCKKTSMLNNIKDGERSVYIGDGKSDICVSKSADIVFAKGYLREYFEGKNLPHIPFSDLGDVHKYFLNNTI